ncbi:Response regulator receiver domain-containing protein [Blastococcus fimeti]|nr:Response regulator receiver domain-containing protein [Blastococcus fimeti]
MLQRHTTEGVDVILNGEPASTVVICDQHLLFGESFAQALQERRREAVVVPWPEDVLSVLESRPVGSVVLDVGFPHGAALTVTRRIRSTWPDICVVCLGEEPDRRHYTDGGADVVLSKKQPLGALVEAAMRTHHVHAPSSGSRPHQAGRGRSAPPSRRDQPLPARFLTSRERDVLRLLVLAHPTSQIAAELGISVATTRGYVQSTFIKLGVHSRVEAVTYAVRNGVV